MEEHPSSIVSIVHFYVKRMLTLNRIRWGFQAGLLIPWALVLTASVKLFINGIIGSVRVAVVSHICNFLLDLIQGNDFFVKINRHLFRVRVPFRRMNSFHIIQGRFDGFLAHSTVSVHLKSFRFALWATGRK